jgi:hypothetical protein
MTDLVVAALACHNAYPMRTNQVGVDQRVDRENFFSIAAEGDDLKVEPGS